MRDQHILDIAKAYQSIYISEDNVNELNLGQLGSTIEKAADTYVKPNLERLAAQKGREKVGNLPILGDIGAEAGRRTASDLYNKAKTSVKTGDLGAALQTGRTALDMLRNSYEPDAFDIILEYLVAEGYADTNKAALAIMANMSEEWKQSIVEAMISEDSGDPLGKIPKLKAEIEIANLKRQRNQQNAASQLRSGSYGVPSYARSQEMDAESRHNEAGLTKAQSRQILAQNRRDLEAAAGLKPGSTEKDAWYNDPNYGKDLDGKMKFFSPRTVLAKQGGVEGKLTVDPNTGKKTFAAGAFTDAEKARYTSKGGK